MVTKKEISVALMHSASALKENSKMLSQLDSVCGDGDHGVTIDRIADTIIQHIDQWQGQSIRDFFDGLGWAITGVNGGSAGPLWGTMFLGFGEGIEKEQTVLDGELLKSAFTSALDNLSEISGAVVGDKTMMDALIPAVMTIQSYEGGIGEMIRLAGKKAIEGAEATSEMTAKFGRAKNYKTQSIGHKDPGAVSIAIFLSSLTSD